jgi:hypothetical protein
MDRNPADYFQGLSAAYTDAIRATDFKCNIIMFFLSIVMGPVISIKDKLPPFLTLPMALTPFLVAFFCLFLAILPRYPRRQTKNFIVSRTAEPEQFAFVPGQSDDFRNFQLRCAILSDILFWKTWCLRIALFVCFFSIVLASVMLPIYAH